MVKNCSACHQTKDYCDFYKHPYAVDGLKSSCKSCHNKTSNNWGKRNPEKLLDAQRRSYSRNSAKRVQSVKAWIKRNYEHARAIKNSCNANRRAALLNATPSWANRKEMMHFYRLYRLARELTLLDGINYQVDHIVPLKSPIVCGLHVENNLQVITATENLLKLNRISS